jgi:hypothetical protein
MHGVAYLGKRIGHPVAWETLRLGLEAGGRRGAAL